MCNVMSNSLFYDFSGFVIEAHLVRSQDLCILVAFGHRLFSGLIHVFVCNLMCLDTVTLYVVNVENLTLIS